MELIRGNNYEISNVTFEMLQYFDKKNKSFVVPYLMYLLEPNLWLKYIVYISVRRPVELM